MFPFLLILVPWRGEVQRRQLACPPACPGVVPQCGTKTEARRRRVLDLGSGVWGDAFSRDSEVQRSVFWFRRGLPEDEIPLQCGFPVIRFVALLSLNRGAILKVMMDGLRSHDLRLFRRLWQSLRTGDIILGDRAFGEYSTLAQLPRQGVDVVARLHHQRKVDFRKAQRLVNTFASRLPEFFRKFFRTNSRPCAPY